MLRIRLCQITLAGSLLVVLGCRGGGGDGGSSIPPVSPSITSFVANPSIITAGGTGRLTGNFANGVGVITPGNIAATSGVTVNVSPAVTTTYTLTVTSPGGTSVKRNTTVTVVPAGAMVISPDSVQASGIHQTTAGGTFSNCPILGEPASATTATSQSSAIHVRHDFTPPAPK